MTQRPPLYRPEATDDLATLDTLLTLGVHLADRSPRGERALQLARGLHTKAARGVALSPIDRGSLQALIEVYERALA